MGSVSRGAVLAVPACEPGRGGGHLIRCMALVRRLRDLGREAYLFLPADSSGNKLTETAHFDAAWIIGETGLQSKNWELIVLDRFQTPPEEFERWAALAPLIGIDEGGIYRKHFDFLIDILSNVSRIKPNIADPSLLPLPEKILKKNSVFGTPLKVLVSFGQEDSAGLGIAVAKAFAAENSNDIEITLLHGGLQTSLPTPHSPLPTLHLKSIPNLSEHLSEYDLIITHYGLTSFEALYAGVPVLLVSPGPYHEKLTKAAGFFSSGTGKKGAVKLARLLLKNGKPNYPFLDELKNRCIALAAKYNLDSPPRQSLAELINGFTPEISRKCIACGTACGDAYATEPQGPVIARFPERTYRRCKRCGIITMNRINPPPLEYDREYFFDSYKKQYGKTYIEDFPNLTAIAKQRLAVIKRLLPKGGLPEGGLPAGGKALLDIGCAYGPFLAAAREEGFSPQGIDPAEDAVRYVTQTLGIPAVQGFFPPLLTLHSPLSTFHSPFSVVTLWYVIEHFRDCVPVLAEIRKLLKPGGVPAFATPSFSGISGRTSLKRFLENSPADHYTIWSPAVCKKILKAAGFKVKKIVITGHHPERFPLPGKFARDKKSPLYGLLSAISKIFGLGDTFEVYAVGE